MNQLLTIVKGALISITNPYWFETERGYQGELLGELRNKLSDCEIEGAIGQQEYQKRMKDHGFRIRPDIIIHIPFEQANYEARKEGNFVVIELKLRASEAQAIADYQSLARMCEILDYPLGIFVNIGSNETYFESYKGGFKDRLHAFGVRLDNGEVVIDEQNSN